MIRSSCVCLLTCYRSNSPRIWSISNVSPWIIFTILGRQAVFIQGYTEIWRKMQQASNSTLSLLAQKYSLDLSNENHIKNTKKIQLFVAHILLYFHFPHSHKSKKWRIRKVERKLYSNWNMHVFQPESLVKTFIRFLNNYSSIHFLLAGSYTTTNWAEAFQILFLLLPIWRLCKFCILF